MDTADDFVACYRAANRAKREESEKFKRFPLATLLARDRVNLDIFRLKDESLDDLDLLPPLDGVAAGRPGVRPKTNFASNLNLFLPVQPSR